MENLTKAQISYTSNAGHQNDNPEGDDVRIERTHIRNRDKALGQRHAHHFDLTDPVFKIAQLLLIEQALPEDEITFNAYNSVLAQNLNIIALSPSGAALVNEASAMGWHLALDDLKGCEFSIDVPGRLITIDHQGLSASAIVRSAYFSNQILLALVRALRDVWQEKRHGAFDDLFSPEAVLMLERVRAADADVLAILVGWELRSEGYNDIWRHMIGTENGDLAMAYSNHLDSDPSASFSGKALRSAFWQWYECQQRIDNCDHNTLDTMDRILATASREKPFGTKFPTHIAIELLSCLPDRTAYLQGHGQSILSDPSFYGLTDPINQSHFLHIMHDMQATIIGHVPFRDAALAARIFPEGASEILEDL